MDRYEVVPAKHWKNSLTGATASIYGSLPYVYDREAQYWSVVRIGWTIRDNKRGTVGICRKPFETEQEAKDWIANRIKS